MSQPQWIVFATLAAALVLFIRGTWRYDLVALLALLVLCLAGIVPPDEAFLGFGHPAVVTVAAVMVISAAMRNAGVVDMLGSALARVGERPVVQLLVMTGVVAVCSAFMNNVGALAILMPVAVHLARSAKRSPSYLLMPLAFGSLLGGMMTLIGTPPNIIIATYRTEASGQPFAMFDFAWVGVGVAIAGVLFIALAGWRLIPQRQGDASRAELFEIDAYTTELRVPDESKAIGMTVRQVGQKVDAECNIVGLARGKRRIAMPPHYESLAAGDILLIEGDADSIKKLADTLELELVGDKELRDELLASNAVQVAEAIVAPGSYIERRTAGQLNLRRRFGVNLLGVARQGHRTKTRMRDLRLRAGDILLLQGDVQAIPQAMTDLGLLPLAMRELSIGRRPRVVQALGLFVAALVVTVLGWLPVQIALAASAVAMVLTRMLTLREMYASVDWSIMVLLGAMLPVGHAMETTGGAQLIADGLQAIAGSFPVMVSIGALLVISTLLSNVINNAAAAVLMAPIGIRLAEASAVSADAFLMAVGLGASSAFLTPIGHQSNTLVMGPGGYRFGDYFKLGLPVTVLTWITGLSLIALWWPVSPGSN